MNKITTEHAVLAYRILSAAKLTKMAAKDKFLVIRAMREIKNIAINYEDFLKDAAKKLRPDDFESIEVKPHKDLSFDERTILEKYNSDVTECVRTELAKECVFAYDRLSEVAMESLIDSNDWSVSEIMILSDILVG